MLADHAILIECEQGTPEWLASRLGRLTGSRAKDMLATIKSGEAAARRDYRLELVCERLTGLSQSDAFVSKEMQRGTDLEPMARAAYEAVAGSLVRQTGFVQHTALMAGCSLDGDVDGFAGIVELKVPKTATHLRYLRAGTMPPEHLAQVVHNLWVTGAQWCDFASFDDRLPEGLQLFVVRVLALSFDLAAYELTARVFLSEVDRELEAVSAMAKAVA